MNGFDAANEPDRLGEIARILAAGILRLHGRAALSVDLPGQLSHENLPEKSQDSLELVAETVLSVHSG